MTENYLSRARGLLDLKAHLVLVTKYRRKALTDEMLVRLADILKELLSKWDGEVIEFNVESDRIHLLFMYNTQTDLPKFINNLKSVTSRCFRKEFADHLSQFYWKDVFWSGSYFIASCGGVTVETLKKYVESQSRPN
ncbi:IS200/IS605 family transposase [Scytonema sp. NUACC21]